MTDVSPCPDCGAAPAWSRCECDFVGVRAKRKHDDRIAELEAEVERLRADEERLKKLAATANIEVTGPDGRARWLEWETADGLRAAIDAARKEQA